MLFCKNILTWLFLVLATTFTLTQALPSQLQYQSESMDYDLTHEQSLFDKLAPESDLSIFLELLMHNDLLFTYFNSTTTNENLLMEQQEGEAFTVFCPTNSAFLDYWKTQPKKTWRRILERHVVPQTRLKPSDLIHAHTLNTLLPGATIHINHQTHGQEPRILLDGDTLVDSKHPIMSKLSIAYKINHVLPSFYLAE